MKQKRNITNALLAGLLLAVAPSVGQAASQSGTTSLTVTMPEYVVLRYYSAIGLNLTASSSNTGSDAGSVDVSWSSFGGANGTYERTLAASSAASDFGPSSVDVTITNAWAIAGLSDSGDAKVTITGDASLDKASSSSSIGMGSLGLASGGETGDDITVPLVGVGGTGTTGDVTMTLDFSTVTESGAHSGTFTITAETI